jgi:Spy/CpxP family protein refolding chaperone
MNMIRLATSTAIAAGMISLLAVPRPAQADSTTHSALQAPTTTSSAAQRNRQTAAAGEDDFAGLDLTAEQKTQIAKIHEGMEARKALVVKDTKLSPEQKDAFILGYTRLEHGEMFKVLTPPQQKQVRKKIADRRAADQAAHAKPGQPKRPQN